MKNPGSLPTPPSLDWLSEEDWRHLEEAREDLLQKMPIYEKTLESYRRTIAVIEAAFEKRNAPKAEQRKAAKELFDEMISRTSRERDDDLLRQLLGVIKIKGKEQ